MRKSVLLLSLALALTNGPAWAEAVSGGTAARLKQLEEKASEAKSGKISEYAADSLKDAVAAIAAAQAATAVGNDKLSQQKIELATLLLTIAEAKGAERELLEQVAVQRVELKKLEAQLERYLQGEEK
ncbi:hypothetical protein KI809_06070 [Geobacter pelophilus]|jgi:hypothetical protein|uniref:Uncharacterized protein n=1 Tax=Geoanaerobacter pelophilus TaxID=60036 RepID=A0AAW4L771_9BACT|nr:hypothetical protein [Geoanaerobacter pelophilus]MBT0663864.1 hypothetical protein [Geoanaerobacter pelophilus]